MNCTSWKLEQAQTPNPEPIRLTDLLTALYQPNVTLSLCYHNRPRQTTLHLNSPIEPLKPLLHTYKITEIPNPHWQWVKAIGQLTKAESFIEPQNYYIPHPFPTQQATDLTPLLALLSRLNGQCCLAITIQPETQNPTPWRNAISQLLTQLEAVRQQSKEYSDPWLQKILETYRYYQQHYAHSPVLRFQIRAFAENYHDASLVLGTLAKDIIAKPSPPLIIEPHDARFPASLKAIEQLEFGEDLISEGWQKPFTQRTIKEAIQAPRRGLDRLDDGSLSFKNLTSPQPPPKPTPLLGAASSGGLVKAGESALAPFINRDHSDRICDLQPLNHLATAEELAGFCPILAPAPTIPDSFNLIDLIAQHGNLINPDQYIVGQTPQGQIITSSWSEIPHRIVAGITGTGKTNFLKSVIYQFLHADPQRQLYLADFQNGLHYQLIADLRPTLNLVTDLEDFAALLATLWEKHESRRTLMREHRVTSLNDLNAKIPDPKQRILLIIDEAFFILNAEYDTKAEIQKYLNTLAAQSRVTGIHIIYCSQRPTPEVIDPQISDNMDERVIFRVQPNASVMLLDNEAAANLPRKPKGRAIYRGIDPDLYFVATPYVPDEIWES
ncbi:FtsK/SpoIIIE domain-containing protein [Spirulina sp. CCNP1310]|uniref:FtsK/SpoIIIE domain-containing protein n=1 Tax=Spirulina sp. CCNP1310 TaxID=3110249 RepID=UPI002B1F1A38|nr:FtsK/SpoIIIE domain-containing protein [Spirulina sp. CCNP1310]MEA5420238.1 FtsK/SpoIIIE domain-containing protein [Spirulina sp. CCNP1310]